MGIRQPEEIAGISRHIEAIAATSGLHRGTYREGRRSARRRRRRTAAGERARARVVVIGVVVLRRLAAAAGVLDELLGSHVGAMAGAHNLHLVRAVLVGDAGDGLPVGAGAGGGDPGEVRARAAAPKYQAGGDARLDGGAIAGETFHDGGAAQVGFLVPGV